MKSVNTDITDKRSLPGGEIGGKQRTAHNLIILVGAVDVCAGVIDLDIVLSQICNVE